QLTNRLGFASHERLVEIKLRGLHETAIGGHLVAHFQDNDVADDDFFHRQAANGAAAQQLDLNGILARVKDFELAIALVFAGKGHARSQYDGDHDGQPFDQKMTAGKADEKHE